MGLLDYLFDNQTYAGAGGLLSRLQPSLGQTPQSNGFDQSSPLDTAQWPYGPVGAPQGDAGPISVGNYQMPRMGSMAQYTPMQSDPAALPQNAQPAQGQLPQAPQPQESPGGFSAGMHGFLNNLQAGPIGALIGGIGSAAGLQSPEIQRANKTVQFLVSKGMDPSAAQAIVADPATLRSVLPQVLGMGGQTDDIKEYEYARKENPGLTFEKFMLQKKANQGEYSLTPQYGTDEKGNTVLIQTGKSGDAIRTKLPEGVKISSGVEKIDAGDKWILYDKRTGTPVGTQPKDLASKEAAEKVGQARGTAQAALANGADIDAEQTKKKIDDLLKSEGLDSIVGPIDQFRPSWTLGKSGRDALARLEQLQGGAFLQAFTTLKGGGAITEIEGAKAEKAIARMQRSQSEEDFRAALKDFRDAIDIGLQKLRRAATGGETPAAASSAAPKRIRLNADGTIAQ